MEMFSLNTDYGLVKVTKFRTLVKDLGNGYEQRISKSSNALREYKLKFSNRLTTDMESALYDFYAARKGAFEAFNIADPLTGETIKVRFKDDELSEELFSRLVENSDVTVVEVA